MNYKFSVAFHRNTTSVNIGGNLKTITEYLVRCSDEVDKLANKLFRNRKDYNFQDYYFPVPYRLYEIMKKELMRFNSAHTNNFMILKINHEPLCYLQQSNKYYTHEHIDCGGTTKEHTDTTKIFVNYDNVFYCEKCQKYYFKNNNFKSTYI